MGEMRIADFLRHDVQAYGVPGAPDIDRILQACIEAANWIDKLESILAQVERERDAAVNDLKLVRCCGTCVNNEGGCTTECYIVSGTLTGWQWRGVCEENTKEE